MADWNLRSSLHPWLRKVGDLLPRLLHAFMICTETVLPCTFVIWLKAVALFKQHTKFSEVIFPNSIRLYANVFLPRDSNLAYNWGCVSSIDGNSVISKYKSGNSTRFQILSWQVKSMHAHNKDLESKDVTRGFLSIWKVPFLNKVINQQVQYFAYFTFHLAYHLQYFWWRHAVSRIANKMFCHNKFDREEIKAEYAKIKIFFTYVKARV
jgi:hypothetical protein